MKIISPLNDDLDVATKGYVDDQIVGSGGGYGPNWVAASNAPTAIKSAVLAAGGIVCDGTNDHTDIELAFNDYLRVCLTEGTYNIAAAIDLQSHGQQLVGAGVQASILKATSAITNRIIYSNDLSHIYLGHFTIDGDGQGSDVNGIEVDASSNSGWPSTQTSEACTIIENIQMHDISGNGLVMTGTYNRDSKIRCVDVHNADLSGFLISCPDGKMSQCVAGSPTDWGFNFDNAANWHADNCKAWFAHEDGFVIGPTSAASRITLTACEAQDCSKAGFRMWRGNAITFTGCIADSNSNGNADTYSGFEIALSAPTTATSYVTAGTTLTGCVAYDKNEGSRGYQQAYGFRFAAGTRRLSFVGCNTGDADNHHNSLGGVLFNTGGDATNSTNLVLVNDEGTILSSL